MIERTENARLRRLASTTSFVLALTLVGVKVVAWALTGSMALLTAAVDGGLDVLTSAVTLMGVRFAERPEDENHRFGHGKGETLAAFVQAFLLAAAGLVLAVQAIEHIADPTPLSALGAGIVMTVGSLAAVGGLVVLQTWVIERTGSAAIVADRQHYVADIIVNIGVLLSLGLTWLTGFERIDPAIGLCLSIYMLFCAWRIICDSSVALLDQELPETERQRILDVSRACAGVVDLHDLRTRNAADRVFIELHLEMDGALSLHEAHTISENVSLAISALYPKAEVLIHQEPAGIEDDRLDERVSNTTNA